MTCSGTGVMQAALENCVARRVLVTTCGAFSERWYNIAESLGYEVDRLDAGWGHAVDPESLADHLARHHRAHYDAVTITHNETSTGVTNDVAALTAVIREEAPDALVLVDAVSSLGGIPVEFDRWGVDVCLASVQKCIALPPGITVVAASNQALARAKKHPYRGTYFDFVAYKDQADNDSVPSTPSIPHFYALAAQLEHILRGEGLEARFERHRRMRDLTHERTARFAKLAADPAHRLADRHRGLARPPARDDPRRNEKARLHPRRRLRDLEGDDVPHRAHGRHSASRTSRRCWSSAGT